jgi:hypothetical protein
MKHRKKRLEGTALATFHHLKDLIGKSQVLFYFDVQPGDEVHLKTDASDYGEALFKKICLLIGSAISYR